MASHDTAVAPDMSAIPPLIEWVERCCGDGGVDGDLTFKMMLAIEEALANIVVHAFVGVPPPHRIQVRLDIAADRCVAEVVDNGHPFDPSAAPPPDLAIPLHERDPGGLGIHLMRQMADRVEYRREDGQNRLRIETARR
jgi:anti-sigma regulatory factor (Ser/Thr protein kinase)